MRGAIKINNKFLLQKLGVILKSGEVLPASVIMLSIIFMAT